MGADTTSAAASSNANLRMKPPVEAAAFNRLTANFQTFYPDEQSPK
jgi:hypothetical protein